MKKSTSKLLSLLLAVIMVIGIFPATAFAADGNVIDHIVVENVKEPVVNQVADKDFTYPENQGYKWYDNPLGSTWFDRYVEYGFWLETDSPVESLASLSYYDSDGTRALNAFGGRPTFNGERFKEGMFYTYVATFDATDNRIWADVDDITATINGEEANVCRVDTFSKTVNRDHPGDAIAVWKCFGPLKVEGDDTVGIDHIVVENVKEPVVNQVADKDFTYPENQGYKWYDNPLGSTWFDRYVEYGFWLETDSPVESLVSLSYYDSDGTRALNAFGGRPTFNGERFKEGMFYTYVATFDATDNRIWADVDDITATINGKEANVCRVDTFSKTVNRDHPGDAIAVWKCFGQLTSIEYASVTVTPPIAGAVPDRSPDVLFPHQEIYNTLWYETDGSVDAEAVLDDLNNDLRDKLMTGTDRFEIGKHYTARVILYPDNSGGSLYYFDKYTDGYINGGYADAMKLRDDGALEIVRSFGRLPQTAITALWDGYKATWEAVDNASRYEVTIYDEDGGYNVRNVTASTTSVDFSAYVKSFGAGKYFFTVFAKDAEGKTIGSGISVEKDLKAYLTGISIKTPPTKTDYIHTENFDPAGMVITATYFDGSTEDISYAPDSGITYTNGSSLSTSQITIPISYTEDGFTKTTYLPISVIPNSEWHKLSIWNKPNKTVYKPGEDFDPTGMEVRGIWRKLVGEGYYYKDLSDDVTYEDDKDLKAGQTSVTVVYDKDGVKATATVSIEVYNVIDDITIDITPNEIPADLSDMTVTAKFKDANGQNADFLTPQVKWNINAFGSQTSHAAYITLTAPTDYIFETTDDLSQDDFTFTSGESDDPIFKQVHFPYIQRSYDGKTLTILTNAVWTNNKEECTHPEDQREYMCPFVDVNNEVPNHEYHFWHCKLCGFYSDYEPHDLETTTVGTKRVTTCKDKCGYYFEQNLEDGETIEVVRLNDPMFYVGGPVPSMISEIPADSDMYEVESISWTKDGSPVSGGSTFGSGEYELTVNIRCKTGYTFKEYVTSVADIGELTQLKMNYPNAQFTINDTQTRFSYLTYTADADGEGGVWTGKIKITPWSTVYAEDKDTVEVTLPSELAGKTMSEAFDEIEIENIDSELVGKGRLLMAVYDITDADSKIEVFQGNRWKNGTLNVVKGSADNTFEAGHLYNFIIIKFWTEVGSSNGAYGMGEDSLNVISNPDLISVVKYIGYTGFSLDAIIAANGETAENTISYAAIEVDAPVKGAAPDTSATTLDSNPNYTVGTPTWSPAAATFAAETEYTVSVVLTADEGYTFTDSVFASVNGVSATAKVDTDDKTKCTVTYTFPKTDADLGIPETVEVSVNDAAFTDAVKGSAYAPGVTLTATITNGEESDTAAWSAFGLPTGMSINATTGLISGTPTESGVFNFTVVATHESGAFGTKDFTLTVTAVPAVYQMSLTGGTEGKAYPAQQLYADNGYPATITEWSATGLPEGLSIDNTGRISGTPAVGSADTYDNIKVTAKNTAGTSAEVNFTLVIKEAPPKIYYLNLPTGAGYTAEVAESYSDEVTAGGEFKFTVTIDDDYVATDDFKVKVNNGSGTDTLTANSNGIYTISNVQEHKNVTVEGVEATFVVAPIISPNGGEFDDKVEVEIILPTGDGMMYAGDGYYNENVMLYYTIDGSNPANSATSKEYVAPFTLTLNKDTEKVRAATVLMGKTPGTAEATFSKKQYNINASDDGHGTATANPSSAAKDDTVMLKATPAPGYRFKEWVVDEFGAPITIADVTDRTTFFTMPAGNVYIYATFEKIPGGGGGGGITYDYYKLTFDTNGGSYIAPITRIEGTNVSLASYTPTRAGYEFTGWYSSAALTSKITSITLNSDKTVYAGWTVPNPNTGGFVDVPEDAYYAEAVIWAVEEGVTSGTSATTFSPNASCTRAQAVTFLWRANGCPEPQSNNNPFADVSVDAYYYKAVLWAVEQGITKGTSATTFSPNDTCTRAQIVTFLYRAAGSPAAAGALFDDVSASAYYADAVKWAVAEGITNGTGAATFSPDANCTRAQIVTFIFRQINK